MRDPSTILDLSGPWRLHESEGDLHQRFVDPEFEDADWIEATVPGHWRSVPALAATDNAVLYRKQFELDTDSPEGPGRRRFLRLDGAFYYTDLWLDGEYLDATEGYFFPHVLEVTDQLAARREHTLAIEVSCPPQRDRTAKRLVTGVFSHWDNLDPSWNPGGLWRPVGILETGPVRISRLRTACVEATEEHGRLHLGLTVDAGTLESAPLEAGLHAVVRGPDGSVLVEQERVEMLARGDNHLAWAIEVDRPPRWWPRRLGDQPLCELELRLELDGRPSDTRTVRTAFREVRMRRWQFSVNGEPIFLMGSNNGPTKMQLAEATPEDLRRDVQLALDANLDLLRVHAHVSRPELYDAADEAGLLLWQDFPLQWGYAHGIRKQAVRQAREMVDLLGHHPSIAIWCAHNEPLAIELQPGEPMRPGTVAKLGASMFLPTWNKDVLDRLVTRAIHKADPSRPVDAHSGVLPGVGSGGTDAHFYFGWYHGELGGLAPTLRKVPSLARFVTEFGAQAVPTSAGFMEPKRWPDLEWDELFEHHACQKLYFDRYVPPDRYDTFEAWQRATQEYQAWVIQLQVEDLRRIRRRPAGGFCHFCFADGHPAVTWSVLDHERVPKLGYTALRDACRPVLPMLEPRTGALHVVNERRRGYDGAMVEVAGPRFTRRFGGDVAADGVSFVGTVPDDELAGDVLLTLRHPDLDDVANRYPVGLLTRVRGA
ncbi:MAG: hypothetical protein U0V73_04185 [Acidimicrobiia bacterium]